MRATRPSESLHWYTRAGEPAYEVEAANGGRRPTTLRDARKLVLVPSVTGIIRCAASPGLELWKQEQVLLAALTLPRKKGETEPEYIARIFEDSGEQARRAAKKGTEIHAAVQGHYEGIPQTDDTWPYVKAACEKVEDVFGKQTWVAERSFAHPLGYGGKVDLSCPLAVVDFKTKEFGPDYKRLNWDEHLMQLAACRHGLVLPHARCANIYISTSHPGLAAEYEWSEEELEQGWSMFEALLAYWKAKNGYDGAW